MNHNYGLFGINFINRKNSITIYHRNSYVAKGILEYRFCSDFMRIEI